MLTSTFQAPIIQGIGHHHTRKDQNLEITEQRLLTKDAKYDIAGSHFRGNAFYSDRPAMAALS